MVRRGVDCIPVCSTNLNRTPPGSPSNEQVLKSRRLSLLFDHVLHFHLSALARKIVPLVMTSVYLDRTAFMQHQYTRADTSNCSKAARKCASRIFAVLIPSHHVWSTTSNILPTIFTFHIYFSRRQASINKETTKQLKHIAQSGDSTAPTLHTKYQGLGSWLRRRDKHPGMAS
jgi:hypothetical protein